MPRARSSRPYLDRPMTDLAKATDVATRAAAHWGLDPPALVRAGMNAIFRAGDEVLRVGTPTVDPQVSLELAGVLCATGLRIAMPQRDDAFVDGDIVVTAWERLVPTADPIDWRSVGEMVRLVHALEPADVPAGYPLPAPTSFAWWDFEQLFDETGPLLDDAAEAGLRAAVDRWPRWREMRGGVVCHGDVHPGNVVMTQRGAVLIDWDLLCIAPPGWDHGPMMTWAARWGGRPGGYERFAAGYGRSMRGDPSAEAFAELRLVAATLMRLKASLRDPAARPEAERRLRFWRGDPDAPPWHAQ